MAVGLLSHERELRWELVSVVPNSSLGVSIEMPAGRDVRSFMKQLDVRALVRMRSQRHIPIRHRIAAAQVRAQGTTVILATDRDVEFLNSLAELCPDVHQILVGHGVIIPKLKTRMRVTYGYANRTFCVWGQREIELVRRLASSDLNLVSLGSLRNAFYIEHRRHGGIVSTVPQRRICLISSFVGRAQEAAHSATGHLRSKSADMVTEHVQRLALAWGMPVIVALKPPTMQRYREGTSIKWRDEMQYFADKLRDCEVSFTDPTDRFSTYMAIDESLVSFGRFTSSVVEGFGRGSNVRSIGVQDVANEWGALPSGLHLTEETWRTEKESRIDWIEATATQISGNGWLRTREYFLQDPLAESPIRNLLGILTKFLD